MSALGIFNIQITDSNQVTREYTYYNKWSSQLVYDLLYNALLNSYTTFNPSKIYFSTYDAELTYTQTSTSVFSGYINTSFSASTSSYGINYTDASYSSTAELNSSAYPCILPTYASPHSYVVDTTGTTNLYNVWDAEPFWVYEKHANQTFLSAAITAGDSTYSVYDASNFKIGEWIYLLDYKVSAMRQISNISGNDITFTQSINNNHESGTALIGDSVLIYTAITTLTSAISAGVNILPVADESAFGTGNNFMLYDATNAKWEGLVVDTTGTNQILITGGVTNAYASGSAVLRGFLSAHAGDNYTITRRFLGPFKYMEFIITDTDATGYGTTPIKTLAIVNSSATTIYASVHLPYGIYKDDSTNIKTMKLAWYLYLAGT